MATTASATTSSLPAGPAAAASGTLDAAIAETTAKENGGANDNSADGSTSGAAGADDSIRTVFNDPENFNVKHPLYHTWTLWFDNPSARGMTKGSANKDTWGEDLNKVVDFDSVEEFWGLYNNIIPPSALPQKANYYLFKQGIQPAWEDAQNANGGKWSIQLPRDKSRAGIDRLWLYLMLAAIGETLEPSSTASANGENATSAAQNDLVTGVIMAARPQFYRINIWTRLAEDPVEEAAKNSIGNRLLEIGKQFKTQILGYDLHQKISSSTGNLSSEVEFQSHKESEKKKGGKKFTV